ncbi:hypothetical protein EYF80_013555 [Liparis tanakae]|uniref:Uncharacterized protein n=1 Tax=Liparis tanakae TaxID=230148 RepID=A0A4Z2IEE2_9TELE|nr:hypothetical protein EYF80_013555 [Liparis tanakae]
MTCSATLACLVSAKLERNLVPRSKTLHALTGNHPELGISVPVVLGGSGRSSVGVGNTAPLCAGRLQYPPGIALIWAEKGAQRLALTLCGGGTPSPTSTSGCFTRGRPKPERPRATQSQCLSSAALVCLYTPSHALVTEAPPVQQQSRGATAYDPRGFEPGTHSRNRLCSRSVGRLLGDMHVCRLPLNEESSLRSCDTSPPDGGSSPSGCCPMTCEATGSARLRDALEPSLTQCSVVSVAGLGGWAELCELPYCFESVVSNSCLERIGAVPRTHRPDWLVPAVWSSDQWSPGVLST